MIKDVLMCLSGKSPARCGHSCETCFRHDSIMIHVCDNCGKELYEEDYHFDGTPEFCPECRKENLHEPV